VKAKTDIVRNVLLHFLRLTVDNIGTQWIYDDLLDGLYSTSAYDNYHITHPITYGGRELQPNVFPTKMIIDFLDNNDIYGQTHDVLIDGLYAKTAISGLDGDIHINKYILDVDTWDIERIGVSIGVWTRPYV
jgi:hypothetical protein